MYEMDRQIFCSCIGKRDEIRNSALVDILQDASNFHLQTHPVLSHFFEENSCVMYLISRQIDILRRPCYGEKIHVKTWTYELKRMYGFRNTVILGEDGKPCVTAIAGGAFMDTVSGRAMKIPQEVVDRVSVYPKFDMEYLPRKIALLDCEPKISEQLLIRRADIDMYGHVNNARYVDIADEFLPENADVRRMRIEYKMPLKRGCKAFAYTYERGDIFTVSINDENAKPYCVIQYTLA